MQLIKQREETEKSMLELKAIRSQLNPHFIFNSLSSIQGLINTNKIESANVYLSEFSNLMRNTLTESDKIFQPLDKEINMLETYLKIEQLRFQFEYSIKVDGNAVLNQIEIPSLLLQPLVENAIKHGVSGLREKGKVDIHFYLKNRNLFAEIEDNGNGLSGKKNPNGYGLKLTDERILLLNKIKGQHIEKKIFRMNNKTVVQIIFTNEN
ncbi:MAG: histidine kinase [Bacteroidetes bacterium]|nr:histidine kinase [Bacteroidota bacterium]